MLRELLSPRSRGAEATGADQDILQLQTHLTLLLGRQPASGDPSMVLLRDQDSTLPLSPLIVERLCLELEKRGLLRSLFLNYAVSMESSEHASTC
jgi:hypothetical protein